MVMDINIEKDDAGQKMLPEVTLLGQIKHGFNINP